MSEIIKTDRYELYKGECLEVMKDMPNRSIDMILCDLPYGTTQCKWDSIIPLDKLWEQYKRIIKDNGAIVLTASQPFTSNLVMSNLKMFKYEWIYQKNKGGNPMNAKIMPMKEHESVLVFGNGKTIYNPQMQERREGGAKRVKSGVITNGKIKEDAVYGQLGEMQTKKYSELRYPSSVQYFNVERGLHPTQKPVPLFEYLIKTYTNEQYTILDNCMGSGTTGVACINTNRNFIGIELDDKYFEISKTRINEALKIHINNKI